MALVLGDSMNQSASHYSALADEIEALSFTQTGNVQVVMFALPRRSTLPETGTIACPHEGACISPAQCKVSGCVVENPTPPISATGTPSK